MSRSILLSPSDSESASSDARNAVERGGRYTEAWWTILVSLLIALIMVAYSLGRTRAVAEKIIAETANLLFVVLEGGVRSSTYQADGFGMQLLMKELQNKFAVRFIALTTMDGLILAHSDKTQVGTLMTDDEGRWSSPRSLGPMAPSRDVKWFRSTHDGRSIMLLYRLLDTRAPGGTEAPGSQMCAFLGMDTKPLDRADKHDRRVAIVNSGAVMAFGCLIALCIIVWKRFRFSRRRQIEAEALIRELALTLPDGLLLLDARGRLAGLNASARTLLGLENVKTERSQAAAIVNRLPSALLEQIHILRRRNVLDDMEICLGDTEHPLHISVRGGRIGNGRGGTLGFLLLLRDVSEVRRLEGEVRRREKLAAVGNLAAGVAHELRNPLSSIKGYATYFSGLFPEGSTNREAALVMVSETERLNRTISELLCLAKPTDVLVCPVQLRSLVDGVVRLITQEAAAHQVEVCVESDSALPAVAVDPDRIKQVILNLCINAIEAMPQGGHLTLVASRPEDASERVRLEVIDTGSGIAPEDLPHIFDPYYTTKGQGTGLGLATVHKIMEAHGGKIQVFSKPGEGTTFTLWFPAASASDGGKSA